MTDPIEKPHPAENDATPLGHQCGARDLEGGRCRLYLGHDGKHGDGEGTVWVGDHKDWTGARTIRSAWERSPLLRSVEAARASCQTCGGPVEGREGSQVCVSGSYLPHPVGVGPSSDSAAGR